MKIDKRLTSIKGSKPVTATQAAGVHRTASAKSQSASDRLHITASAGHLNELEKQLAGLNVENAEKVKAVRLAINSGSFKVDSEVVADRLIDNAKDLVRKRPRKA